MYLVCWNHDCRQTYDASNFKPDDKNIECEKCGGTLISNSGKIELSNNPHVIKTVDPKKHEEVIMNIQEIEKRYAKGYEYGMKGEIELFNDMEWLIDEVKRLQLQVNKLNT